MEKATAAIVPLLFLLSCSAVEDGLASAWDGSLEIRVVADSGVRENMPAKTRAVFRDGQYVEDMELILDCSQASLPSKSAPVHGMHGSLGLSAYVYQGNWNASVQPLFMYNERCVSSGDVYRSENKYPDLSAEDRKLRFYAYAPYNPPGAVLSSRSQGGVPSMKYTVPENVTDMSDIMVGYSPEYVGKSGNPCIAFSHAMSAISFALGSSAPSGGTIKHVALRGVYGEGTLFMDGNWNQLGLKRDFDINLNMAPDGVEGTPITESGQTMMMIPQTVPDGAEIEIVYSDGVNDITLTCSIAGDVWQQGKINTYKLNFSAGVLGGDPVLINAELLGNYVWYDSDVKASGGAAFPSTLDEPLRLVWSNGARENVSMSDSRLSLTYSIVEGSASHGALLKSPVTGGVIASSHGYVEAPRKEVAKVKADLVFEDGEFTRSFSLIVPVYQQANALEYSFLIDEYYEDAVYGEKEYAESYEECSNWSVTLTSDKYSSANNACPSSGGSAVLSLNAYHTSCIVTPWSRSWSADLITIWRNRFTSGDFLDDARREEGQSGIELGTDTGPASVIQDSPEITGSAEGFTRNGYSVLISSYVGTQRRSVTYKAENGSASSSVTLYQDAIDPFGINVDVGDYDSEFEYDETL